MRARVKKLIGMAILVPGLAAYLFAAAALGEATPDHWLVRLVYFVVAGVAWAFPVKHLMRWMNAEPADRYTGS